MSLAERSESFSSSASLDAQRAPLAADLHELLWPAPASSGAAQQGRQAAQKPSGATALGSGGDTVPRSGSVSPPSALPFPESAGSSSVQRWSLLARVRRLCRPENPLLRGPAVCGCGTPGYEATSVNVHYRSDETTGEFRAGVSGVLRCGSPWLCPVCAVSKALERAEKVEEVAVATYAQGGQVGLLVVTASHSAKTSLLDVKNLVSGASSLARKGGNYTRAQEKYKILGVIVGQEVTYSAKNGWHYHQHLCIPVDGPTDAEKARAGLKTALLEKMVRDRANAAAQWLAEAYKREIRLAGGKVSEKHGTKIRVADDWEDASGYTSKGSMAWEVSGFGKTETKAAASMTPWAIAMAASEGDAFMVARWHEYANVMSGLHTCVVSAALKEVLGIAKKEKPKGDQELHERDDVVGRVDAPVWSRWMRHGLAATFLSRIEIGGRAGFDGAVAATEADATPLDVARRAHEMTPEYQAKMAVWQVEADAKAEAKRKAQEAKRADPVWAAKVEARRSARAAKREADPAWQAKVAARVAAAEAAREAYREAMTYEPTVVSIALLAEGAAVGRSRGQAVAYVLAQERARVEKAGMTWVSPDVAEVVRLVADAPMMEVVRLLAA